MFSGIAIGLTAACLQSLSYVFSRGYMTRCKDPVRLMVVSQMILGCASSAILLTLTPLGMFRELWRSLYGIFLCAGGYIVGQFFFFSAQRKIECSRLASLYSTKILFVAVMAALMVGETLSWLSCVSVLMAVASVFLINYRRGTGFNGAGLGQLLVAIIAYSLSDIGGKVLLNIMRELEVSPLRAGLVTVSFGSLPATLVLLPYALRKRPRKEDFIQVLPYSCCWFLAVICTFVGFGLIGVTFGNVVQSSRGIISLLLGILLSCLGVESQEKRQSAAEWRKRGLGALMMFLAIALFAFSRM